MLVKNGRGLLCHGTLKSTPSTPTFHFGKAWRLIYSFILTNKTSFAPSWLGPIYMECAGWYMKISTFVKASSCIILLRLSKLNNDSISAAPRHVSVSFERYDCPKIAPQKLLQHFSLHLCKSIMKSFQETQVSFFWIHRILIIFEPSASALGVLVYYKTIHTFTLRKRYAQTKSR